MDQEKMVYSSLLRYKEGGRMNQGNLIRMARSVGINNPLTMTMSAVRCGLQVCAIKCKDLRKTGWLLRRQHLRARCDAAQEKEDNAALSANLTIIKREQDKSFWCRLRLAMGKKRGRSVTSV